MKNSKYYDLVKNNYNRGFWSISKVRDAVEKGWITEKEFKEITNEDY